MRAVLIGLAAIAALFASFATIAWSQAQSRIDRTYPTAERHVAAASGAQAIARGRALAHGAALCAFCHGDDLGGKPVVDDRLLGVLDAPNLTSGAGGLADWSDTEIAHAIRRGVGRDGRSLLVMPSEHLAVLADEDLGDLLAYLRAAAPVDRHAPTTRVGPVTRIVLAIGLSPELLAAERAHQPARADLAPGTGAYWVAVGSCRVCHRDDLRGGLHPLSLPDEPEPPDLTEASASASWSDSEFAHAMRTGVTPDGRALDPRYMPWPSFARLEDEQLHAIHGYLKQQR